MSELSQKDLDAAIEDHMMREQKEALFLNQLLGKFRRQASRHFVLQVRMGEVSSYLTSVRLTWVHQKVRFAADLPIFRESSEGSKRISVDPETLEMVQQRQPDWRRQLEMATYLTTTHHKFPPLLLVGHQHWVFENKDEKWGTDERATCDSLTLTGLDPTGIYWGLDDTETEFYALDGQHRLMAILGLRDLIQNGKLHALDQEGNPKKGRSLSREEIIDYLHNSTGKSRADIHERLQCLMDERIGVEIVPAVCQGETYDKALRRLRQLFVDVNEHAKRLSSSELVQLDENNGYRVVCRRLLLLPENKLCYTAPDMKWPKVDTTRITLPERSNSYTTLKTLAEIVKRYLTENKVLPESDKYVSWGQAIAKGIYFRPEEKELDRGQAGHDGILRTSLEHPLSPSIYQRQASKRTSQVEWG